MTDDSFRSVYRILDASANRAGEGMRTLEEFARFILGDAPACESWKKLRHDLTSVVNRFSRQGLLESRDTPGDVGTTIRTPSEYQRQNVSSVIAAAAARTQQSLRTLEEYGKTIDPQAAADFEQIRYRCYSLSADLELRSAARQQYDRLQSACLYALVGCDSNLDSFVASIATLADAGVDLFQLRDADADDRTLLDRARVGTQIADQHGALLIVNDRPDIAIASGAHGVHVGQEEMPVAATRQIVGPNRMIGVSTHNIKEARQAVADGADYIGCGPVFPGRTKNFESFPGPKFLEQISAEISLPSFAIGGIDLTNVDQVIRTGIRRIAVTAAIRDADDPRAAAGRLKAALHEQD